MKKVLETLSVVTMGFLVWLCIPNSLLGAEKLIVKDGSGAKVFEVTDNGSVSSASRLLTNGASAWGSAPFVLGQNVGNRGNRGIVITNKAANNPKIIYFGWDVGASQNYAEMFALQEGVAFMNLVFNPLGGNVGIGTTSPSHPLQMGSGAYVSTGGVWTNASSREYKTDIKQLTKEKAIDALTRLDPVEFAYKINKKERHVGFIAEDAPDIVSTQDKRGMSAMDVVAVLTRVVQEQQRTIAELSERLDAVEKDKFEVQSGVR